MRYRSVINIIIPIRKRNGGNERCGYQKEVMKSEEENRVKLRREKKIRAERTNTMLRLSSNW